MADYIASLGAGFVLLVVVLWLAIISATVIMPFVLISVARSLRAIHQELRRLNDGHPAALASDDPHVYRAPGQPSPSSLGHQLLR